MIWRALVFIYDCLFTLTLKMSLIWLLKWMNFRAQEYYGVTRCHPWFLWYLMQKMFQAELHKTKAGNELLHTQLKSSFGWEGCEIACETEGGGCSRWMGGLEKLIWENGKWRQRGMHFHRCTSCFIIDRIMTWWLQGWPISACRKPRRLQASCRLKGLGPWVIDSETQSTLGSRCQTQCHY